MIYEAPGKVVAWGEYAVLAGAPAVVLAVDRMAQVELKPAERDWSFVSRGFLSPGVHTATSEFNPCPAARLINETLRFWGNTEYPEPFRAISDSADFYRDGQKLGIGSSAAVCVATYAALADLLDRKPDLEEAHAIHQAFQGGAGSGLDVATCWHGGVVRFVGGSANQASLPDNLYWQIIWTGRPSETPARLASFSDWRGAGPTPELDALCQSSTTLTEEPSLSALENYVESLRTLDEAAKLGIYTPEHSRLETIASTHPVVYKPCGAGGGDIGAVFSDDPQALTTFSAAAHEQGFMQLDLELAEHGVRRIDG